MLDFLLQRFKSLAEMMHRYTLLRNSWSLTSLYILTFRLRDETLVADGLSPIAFHLTSQHFICQLEDVG
jgi:hypothetical protein